MAYGCILYIVNGTKDMGQSRVKDVHFAQGSQKYSQGKIFRIRMYCTVLTSKTKKLGIIA